MILITDRYNRRQIAAYLHADERLYNNMAGDEPDQGETFQLAAKETRELLEVMDYLTDWELDEALMKRSLPVC